MGADIPPDRFPPMRSACPTLLMESGTSRMLLHEKAPA